MSSLFFIRGSLGRDQRSTSLNDKTASLPPEIKIAILEHFDSRIQFPYDEICPPRFPGYTQSLKNISLVNSEWNSLVTPFLFRTLDFFPDLRVNSRSGILQMKPFYTPWEALKSYLYLWPNRHRKHVRRLFFHFNEALFDRTWIIGPHGWKNVTEAVVEGLRLINEGEWFRVSAKVLANHLNDSEIVGNIQGNQREGERDDDTIMPKDLTMFVHHWHGGPILPPPESEFVKAVIPSFLRFPSIVGWNLDLHNESWSELFKLIQETDAHQPKLRELVLSLGTTTYHQFIFPPIILRADSGESESDHDSESEESVFSTLRCLRISTWTDLDFQIRRPQRFQQLTTLSLRADTFLEIPVDVLHSLLSACSETLITLELDNINVNPPENVPILLNSDLCNTPIPFRYLSNLFHDLIAPKAPFTDGITIEAPISNASSHRYWFLSDWFSTAPIKKLTIKWGGKVAPPSLEEIILPWFGREDGELEEEGQGDERRSIRKDWRELQRLELKLRFGNLNPMIPGWLWERIPGADIVIV